MLSAEIHQVVLSSSPLSIWLQWNLCWAGTNKPNLVSNIISLEPNLISAPVCFSRQWLSPSLSPLLFIFCSLSLSPSVHPSISLCECHLPSELATLGLGLSVRAPLPWLEALFSLWICERVCASVCVLEENVRETVICYISEHSSSEILWVCE